MRSGAFGISGMNIEPLNAIAGTPFTYKMVVVRPAGRPIVEVALLEYVFFDTRFFFS